MSAIYKRELKSYFTSPVGYAVLAAFAFFNGIFFYVQCLFIGTSNMSSVFNSMFSTVIFIIPLITMRLFAEDRKNKTDQALLTAPVSIPSIVAAKYLSALTLLALCLSVYLVDGLVLSFIAKPDWSVILGNIFGMLLTGSAFIAAGIFISSLTESVIVAAIVSFVVNVLITLVDTLSSTINNETASEIIRTISFQQKYSQFSLGVISFSDVLFFLSVTFFFLFITERVIERRRWA